MDNSKVSVIVPVYNGEKYIEESVKFLMNQSYDNTEIIIVNDGSTDNTQKILKKISTEYSNIVVINQKNTGVSEARNQGISVSSGKYIMFMDSDDSVHQDWVKTAVEHIGSGEYELAVSGYDVKKRENGENDSKSLFGKAVLERDEIIDRVFIHRDILPAIWNKIFLSEIIKNNSIRFNKKYAIGEDLLFLIEYMTHIKKAIIYPDRTYIYYLNAQGAMQAHNSRTEFKTSWLTEWQSVIEAENLLGRSNINSESIRIKKVRIADKLISIIERYGYETPLKKEMLSFLRKNTASVILKKEFGIKKKFSIVLNCISPKMKKYVNKGK